MRLKYYTLTLRQMSLKKPFVFFLITILFTFIIAFVFNNKVQPVISTLCEANSRYIALTCTEEAVSENISDIEYANLITIQKDSNGKVTALNANVMEMNKISNNISRQVQEELYNTKESYITIPLGSVVGNNVFGGYGPKMKIKTVPAGNVITKFKSEFESAGINQTRHRIFLEVTTKVMTVAPFYTATQEYITDVTVAETVIVSDTPNAYYNINGVTDLTQKDSLQLVEPQN